VYPGFIRASQYAIWDHYAVDRYGAFRPRVADTPFGAFYTFDGRPYPWVTTNSLNVLPSISNRAQMSPSPSITPWVPLTTSHIVPAPTTTLVMPYAKD
jgi:hypothetical protein